MGNGPSSEEDIRNTISNNDNRTIITQSIITNVLADTLNGVREIKEEEEEEGHYRGALDVATRVPPQVRLMGNILSSAAKHWSESLAEEREDGNHADAAASKPKLQAAQERLQHSRAAFLQQKVRDEANRRREREEDETWMFRQVPKSILSLPPKPKVYDCEYFARPDSALDAIIEQYCRPPQQCNEWAVPPRPPPPRPRPRVGPFEGAPLAVALAPPPPPMLHVPPRLVDKEASAGTPEERLCQVCMVNFKCVVMQPCGQVATCLNCTQRLFAHAPIKPACPGCAQPVASAQGMFL
jgi:hypothetical protein